MGIKYGIMYDKKIIEVGGQFNIDRRWKMVEQQRKLFKPYYLNTFLESKGIKVSSDMDYTKLKKVKIG